MADINIIYDREVHTQPADLSLEQIRSMVDKGRLITSPIYQREFLKEFKKGSRLIESILLGIPIPTVYLCVEEGEKRTVIDGQQRLTLFVKFLKNEYKLESLEILKELNGKRFRDLEDSIQAKLESSTIPCITLLKDSEYLKYDIFSRLNLGSTALKPQELRNCIYRGTFNDMLKNISQKYEKMLESLFKQKNERMCYQELILRFFALRNYNDYKSSMPKTLNSFIIKHQNAEEDKIKEFTERFIKTIKIIKTVLGDNAFMLYDKNSKKFKNKFSPTVYDAIMIPFSLYNNHAIMKHSDEIRNKIEDIRKNDETFYSYTEKSTSTKSAVLGRITIINNAIRAIMTNNDIDGEPRAFSKEIKEKLWHDGYICSYCGNQILSIDDAEVDHIEAYSLGGDTDITNAALLHSLCNKEKSNKENEDDWTDNEDDVEEE